MIDVQPVTLEGQWARLAPLEQRHAEGLTLSALDQEVWRYLTAPFESRDDVEAWVRAALAQASTGAELPFVTINRETDMPIGSTRVLDIRPEHRGVEIGYTWLGTRWWRTRINSETKYLLLRHLFETVGCIRVCLKTDLLNERSQRAIARLGAVREGVLRKHMVVVGGRIRDSVYYSIVDDEWPGIRLRMEDELYGDAVAQRRIALPSQYDFKTEKPSRR